MGIATVGRGTAAWAGFSIADHRMTHKDPVNFLVQKSFGLKQDVKINPIPVLTPGMQEPINYRYEGIHSIGGNVQTPWYPEQTIQLLKSIFGSVNTTTLISGAYNHQFLGQDTVPNVPLAFTMYEDLSCMNLVGCYPQKVEFDIEKGNPVQINMSFQGMHGFDQIGTAGTSTGQNAVSFPVTLVVSTSDQIDLAVDGGSPVAVTIAAGTYSTAATLQQAINDAIEATSSLLDSYRRPMVACHVSDTTNKVGFYSGSKGASSAVAWTAGTHDASTLLGKGTPVEAAGSASNSKPSESLIQPFIATKVRALIGGPTGTEIPGVEKLKIVMDNGMGLIETIGYFFAQQPAIHKRRAATVTFDWAFTDTSILAKYLANTTVSFYVLLETGVVIGSTVYKYQANIYLNSCKITKIPLPNVSGQDYIKQTVEAQGFYDASHQDIEINVQNSLAEI